MTLITEELRLFVLTVESGGFSAAGRRLGLAPSSVARRIEALEQDVGARLFHRSTRRLGLTEAGTLLLDRGRAMIANARDLRAALTKAELAPSGTLRISASIGFGRLYVAPALGAFRRAYPEVSIDLRLEDRVVDLLEAGVDIAVRVGRLRDSNLRHVMLAPVRRVACASPDYILRAGMPQQPRDLLDHDCLVVDGAGGEGAWRFARIARLSVPRRIVVSTPAAAVAAAVGGAGVAHLPAWKVARQLAEGRLVRLLAPFEPEPSRGNAVHLVWPEHPPAKTTAFVSFFKAWFAASAPPLPG